MSYKKLIGYTITGKHTKTNKFLKYISMFKVNMILEKYGVAGVNALRNATPKDTYLTSESWEYVIEKKQEGYTLSFKNRNVINGVNIAIILQYGHGTRNGGYVTGIDYINPALEPIFKSLAEEAWREVIGK